MRSTINFETHISNDKVCFLDVEVHLMNGQLLTNLYTKPTDAHLYLNAKSSHPAHVTRNMPKVQFIRIRRICSKTTQRMDRSWYHSLLRGATNKAISRNASKRSCVLTEKRCLKTDPSNQLILNRCLSVPGIHPWRISNPYTTQLLDHTKWHQSSWCFPISTESRFSSDKDHWEH